MQAIRTLPSIARATSSKINLSSLASKSLKSTSKFSLQQSVKFSGLSTLNEKERGEEARYIHAQEAKRQAELKAKLEAILAQSDESGQKSDIINIIEGKTESKSIFAQYGLDSPILSGAIAAAFVVPLISKGYIVFNEETYVLLAFGVFFGTVVTQGGPLIAKEFDNQINTIRTSLRNVDDSLKQKILDESEEVKGLVGVDKVVSELHTLVDDLSVAQAESLNAANEHKYRDMVSKKLDSLVALENAAASALRQRALSEVTSNVVTLFKTDKKVKESALNQALAVLAGGPNTKNGKDIVGETFISALKTYKTNYSKQAPGSDKIIATLEKDIAAILEEPVLEDKGGNVYVTHPVSQKYVA